MKAFMDRDFLLGTKTAEHLFHDYAENLPIIDYHCHLSPKEIAEDIRFSDLGEVWFGGRQSNGTLAGDHYKWRLLRANGNPEHFVTGREDEFGRFFRFAETLELSIGNPMLHWCNLELQKYFGVKEALNTRNAKEIWEHCNDLLRNDPGFSARGLIRKSNVAYIGTTDDPLDSLEYHEKIEKDPDVSFLVRPSFRPDKAIDITNAGFRDYIGKLSGVTGRKIEKTEDVIEALLERLVHFVRHGCVASDHGLLFVPFRKGSMETADEAFKKAMSGEALSAEEADVYRTKVLCALAGAYHKHDIAMEIHYSVLRNVNERTFRELGPDTGYDMIARTLGGESLTAFLSELDSTGELPKTIIFSLDPSDNEQIGTMIGCFQSDEVPGKIQHGPAWWFNDTRSGMEAQMKSLANLGILGNFIGMLTDSRSFLSYARHDYFRRILCNMIGDLVENGEYPNDEQALKRIVEGISFLNAKRYFNLPL